MEIESEIIKSDLNAIDIEFDEITEKDIKIAENQNIENLREIALKAVSDKNIEDLEQQEQAVIKLATHYLKNFQDSNLLELFPVLRSFLKCNNKTRTAKLIRVILDILAESSVDRSEAIKFCIECVEWARDDKKMFLCQILEIKLSFFLYETHRLTEAVELGERLVVNFRKMSYKDELIEQLLTMCKIYFVMKNFQKCRAILTSIRTTANTTHLSPKIQAHIDLMSGSIHCKETDYITAYSYFIEAFELFDTIENRNAIKALKYMLFCKIMLGRLDEVPSVLSGKLSLKYRSRELDAMKAVAVVFKNKNLSEMNELIVNFEPELVGDPIIQNLHDTLFENNLLMVIEPYSIVEINHIAKLVNVDVNEVITRIARLILDGKLNAILDQGFGFLEVFPFDQDDDLFKTCTQSVSSLSNIVEILRKRRSVIV